MRLRMKVTVAQTAIFIGLILMVLLYSQNERLFTHNKRLFFRRNDKLITNGDAERVILNLMSKAEAKHRNLLENKPNSLKEAHDYYVQKFKRYPPPRFDRWWAYCEKNNVDFAYTFLDTVHKSLFNFWALTPKDIRTRATALEKNLEKEFCLVKWKNAKFEGVGDGCYRFPSFQKMLEDLGSEIPDLNLILNLHDAPRVIPTFEEAENLHQIAKAFFDSYSLPDKPVGEFSAYKVEEEASKNFKIVFKDYVGKSNFFLAQEACPRNSKVNDPAGVSDFVRKNVLDIVRDSSDSKEICHHPEYALESSQFIAANGGIITRSFLPVFSDALYSVYKDINFPMGIYFTDTFGAGDYSYDGSKDVDWDKKETKLIYRGGATGGVQSIDNWYYLQRQRFALTGKSNNTFYPSGLRAVEPYDWQLEDYKEKNFDVGLQGLNYDVSLKILPTNSFVPMRDQFINKYIMDLDGFSNSARFKSLLLSKSLTLKATVVQEWHDTFLIPWYDYVPIDESFADLFLVYGFFAGIDTRDYKINSHDHLAKQISAQGTETAEKYYRFQDIRAFYHILLLEYARLVDDNRDMMGFKI